MNSDGSDFFEEFMKNCQNMCGDFGSNNNSSYNNCSDIPGGFQDINPQLLLVIGELLGNVMAGNLPFNVQNVIGNWLQLVGQAIEVFNAQQQYFQGGPGRYYNLRYKNVNNPFCSNKNTTNSSKGATSTDETRNEIIHDNDDDEEDNTSSSSSTSITINELINQITEMKQEISNLKNQVNELKNIK